jgi:hypothetical protein
MRLRLPAQRRLLCSLMLLPTLGFRPDTGTKLDVAGTVVLAALPGASVKKDAAGQPAFIGESKGSNTSTGSAKFMDGATVVSADTARLVNGTGPHHGWVTMMQGADRVVFEWKGQVTTVVAADKTPRSTFAGTWKILQASGSHAGIGGHGTYTGRFTSGIESVTTWKGMIDR